MCLSVSTSKANLILGPRVLQHPNNEAVTEELFARFKPGHLKVSYLLRYTKINKDKIINIY